MINKLNKNLFITKNYALEMELLNFILAVFLLPVKIKKLY